MRVSDIMTRTVECVSPEDTIQAAARKMKDLDVGPLPVCGDNDRLVGMITDRDITIRATAEGLDPKSTRVGDVMSEQILYCFDDQDVREAARNMQEQQVRRLVVLNRDKRLVGIIALGDIATETPDTDQAGRVLEQVSEPTKVRP